LIFGYALPNYVANKLMPFNSEKNSPVIYMFSEADAGLPAMADRKAREAAAKEITKAETTTKHRRWVGICHFLNGSNGCCNYSTGNDLSDI
jgi:hypothetical protein